MTKADRDKLAHDTEIDIGAPDEDSAYVTLGKLRSLLADSACCERLKRLVRELWGCRHDDYLDGQDIADLLVDCKLATWTTAEAPCKEDGCLCAEGGEFPTGCLRLALEIPDGE